MCHQRLSAALIILLLAACGGGSTTDQAPALDPAFWDDLTCADLEGLAFAVTYYKDGQAQGNEVLRFANGTMNCDGCVDKGLAAAESSCHEQTPGTIIAKQFIQASGEVRRRYVFTIGQGRVDGTVDLHGSDGAIITQTFAGTLTR